MLGRSNMGIADVLDMTHKTNMIYFLARIEMDRTPMWIRDQSTKWNLGLNHSLFQAPVCTLPYDPMTKGTKNQGRQLHSRPLVL